MGMLGSDNRNEERPDRGYGKVEKQRDGRLTENKVDQLFT